jgi:hypothetical protein
MRLFHGVDGDFTHKRLCAYYKILGKWGALLVEVELDQQFYLQFENNLF